MKDKTPLIRLAKREDMGKGKVWLIRLAAFGVAILVGMIIFAIAGADPIKAYGTMLASSLGKKSGIRQVVKNAVPLLGVGLALAPCFRMRYWNIGAEGQITMGAMAASYFALFWYNKLPSAVLLIVMALAGMIFGAFWAAIPAAFKARWGTNETLFTLMMNYIAIGIVA